MTRHARLVAVWVAFLLAHAASITLGWLWPNQPMGDTYLVYEPWSELALSGQAIMGVTDPWVYPPLALAPMVLAQTLVWLPTYPLAWAVLVAIVNAVAFGVLVGRGSSRARLAAGAYWAAFTAVLGPIALFRLDAITVPLAILGLLAAIRRPVVAGVVVGAATWMKVWPAALVAALVVSVRGRWRIVAGGAAVSAAVSAVVALAGGAEHLLGFITTQGARGLQIEAIAATPFVLGAGDATIAYDTEILTYQVSGRGVAEVVAVLTPLMAVAALAVAAAGVWRIRGGSPVVRVLPPLALALVVVLIVFNKVGSPQFQTWLIPPLVLWLAWDRARAWGPALLALVAAALTHVIYPVTYHLILMGDTLATAVLGVRNVVVIALGAWAVVRLIRTPTNF